MLRDKINDLLDKSLVPEAAKAFKGLPHAAPPQSVPQQILALDASEDVKGIIKRQWEARGRLSDQDSEKHECWLKWMLALPYRKRCTPRLCAGPTPTHDSISALLRKVREGLDRELYGMDSVKQRLIMDLCIREQGLRPGRTIALVGKPGCGKTAIILALAKIRGVPFKKINVGGRTDAAWIRGAPRVWVGARPSELLLAMADMGCCDGMVLLDEVDKAFAGNEDGDCDETRGKMEAAMGALLAVLDPAHNNEVTDDFLTEIPHDLSLLDLYLAMNQTSHISRALLDRLDIIEVPEYTHNEKVHIVSEFLLPRALEMFGMSPGDATITPDAVALLLSWDIKSQENGIRGIESHVEDITKKLSTKRVIGDRMQELKFDFDIPDFSLPLRIDTTVLMYLMRERRVEPYMAMYA